MVHSVTPMAGGRILQVNDPHNDFTLGTTITANDGHVYIYAKATGTINNAAAAVLTEPAMTMAAGAGAWTNTNGVQLVANDEAWFKKTAI